VTREQLSRRNLKGAELKVRNKQVLRLLATGLYNCTQIAEAYNRSPRLISRIRADRFHQEPVNPWMTISECAEYLNVSHSVIEVLIDNRYIEACTFLGKNSPGGVTLDGAPISLAVRKAWLFKNKDRWGTSAYAAQAAGISRKGMETRARQGRVVTIKASEGKPFTVDGHSGWHYIYDLTSISPEISEPTEEQLEMPLEPAKEIAEPTAEEKYLWKMRADYSSDQTAKDARKTLECDKELTLILFHTEGKQSKATTIQIVWNDSTGQPDVAIITRSPVTVRRPNC